MAMTPDEAWAALSLEARQASAFGHGGIATAIERHRPIIEAAIRASEPPVDVERLRRNDALVQGLIDRLNAFFRDPTNPALWGDLDGYGDMVASEYAALGEKP